MRSFIDPWRRLCYRLGMRSLRAPAFGSLFRADIPQVLLWICIVLLPFVGGANPSPSAYNRISKIARYSTQRELRNTGPRQISQASLQMPSALSALDVLPAEAGEDEDPTHDHWTLYQRARSTSQALKLSKPISREATPDDLVHRLANTCRAPPQS